MKAIGLLALCVIAAWPQETPRPKITGVAHMALFVKDVDQARRFYTGLLGYEEAFDLKNPDGKLSLTFFKINERQYLEIFPEREPGSDRLNHIALETDDAEAMRRYLGSKGIKVPESVPRGRTGSANFTVRDPDGHTVEFVQYLPGSQVALNRGKKLGTNRVSDRMMHVGIIVNSLDPAMQFYRDVLGFTELWRGSPDGKVLRWVNMKLPDSDDYVEFMLHDPVPEPTKRGSAHHICLAVADIEKSAADLKGKAEAAGYARAMEVRTGTNRKRQLNLFDPDGSRVELMEPRTIDGQPAPSSTAAPPK